MDINKVWHKLTESERQEIERLLAVPVIPDVLKDTFPLQERFILDPSPRKILFCTRRASKSYTAGLALIHTAINNPQTNSVYISLHRDQAKRIIWNDILKAIVNKYSIPAKFNETELTITFDNASIIYVLGVDDSVQESEKLYGKKWKLACIDESASFTRTDLKDLVFKVLTPALADQRGQCLMMGTPDNRRIGLFYELTKDLIVSPPQQYMKEGWSMWSWDTTQNPFMAKQWDETIRDLKASDPHIEEQNYFQQHYRGRWTTEEDALIYRYRDDRNGWDGNLPKYGEQPYEYSLGIDLGWNDASALALLAFNRYDKNVYVVRTWKARGLTLTELAAKIRDWMTDYPINYFIVDGAAKQSVMELVKHHELPLVAAEKADKVNFIRIMNSDFVAGKIKVDRSASASLIEEYGKAMWDTRAMERGIYKEDFSFHPDIADAALYSYRNCYHYLSEPDTFAKQAAMTDYDREIQEMNARYSREKMERDELLWGNEHLFQ